MGVREACSAHAIVYTAVQVELGKHERQGAWYSIQLAGCDACLVTVKVLLIIKVYVFFCWPPAPLSVGYKR